MELETLNYRRQQACTFLDGVHAFIGDNPNSVAEDVLRVVFNETGSTSNLLGKIASTHNSLVIAIKRNDEPISAEILLLAKLASAVEILQDRPIGDDEVWEAYMKQLSRVRESLTEAASTKTLKNRRISIISMCEAILRWLAKNSGSLSHSEQDVLAEISLWFTFGDHSEILDPRDGLYYVVRETAQWAKNQVINDSCQNPGEFAVYTSCKVIMEMIRSGT